MEWEVLRARVNQALGELRVPLASGPGCCVVCRDPTRRGYTHCFHCAEHRRVAGGLLADVVVPVSYSVAGTAFARKLWVYKADAVDREEARAALRVLLLVFLREHGGCVWRAAGVKGPTHVAVVPTGQGRVGVHPLREMIEPFVKLEWVQLAGRPGEVVWGRELEPGRFDVAGELRGASVLLLDDTWTTGASVQSAAVALKRAGAERVAAVVLGRHVNPGRVDGELMGLLLAESASGVDQCALEGGEQTRVKLASKS